MWRPRFVILFLILVLILSAGGSHAATLDHCIEAEAAYQAGHHDLEIEHYTRCIDGSGALFLSGGTDKAKAGNSCAC